MNKNEDMYVPFNYFTLQEKQKSIEHLTPIQDKDAHDLKGEFTANQLEHIDHTLEIVDGIEKMLKRYGKKLEKDCFVLEDYDEEGNYHSEEDDEEEHKITLLCFPGVFIKKSTLEKIEYNYLKKWNTGKGYIEYDFDKNAMTLLPELVFENKVYLRISVRPSTLFGDHYRDLLCDDVDVRKEFISGIVDIEKLCDELKVRGIDIEFTTTNTIDLHSKLLEIYTRLREGKIDYDEYNIEAKSYLVNPTLDYVNFNQFVNNLVDTRMQSSLTMSIPFGKYLRETKEFHK